MAMKLENVVPFGRSLDEYKNMFALSDKDLSERILGAGDGPASFNAELTKLGGNVVSVDPLYRFSAEEIDKRFHDVLPGIIDQVRATPDDWVWSYHGSPEGLRYNRTRVAEAFVNDYSNNRESERYIEGQLPALPFDDKSFDLALCSHFLFLYSDHFDADFHLNSVLELLRVAREVRIFPLMTLMLKPSQHVAYVIECLGSKGYIAERRRVTYELQRGGNEMLLIREAGQQGGQPDAFGAGYL